MFNVFGNTMHNHYESILFVKVKIKRAITSRNAKFLNIEHLQISLTIPNLRNRYCLITLDSINLKVTPILLSKAL